MHYSKGKRMQDDKSQLKHANKKKYESERQLERQKNILATARDLLAEIGYARTTIRLLAEKAEVAPGTLYNLYKSKDALIIAAVEEVLADLSQGAEDTSEPGFNRIIAIGRGIGYAVQKNPGYAEAMTRALFGGDQNAPLTAVLYRRFVPQTVLHLKAAKQQGWLRPEVNCNKLARHLQAQSWGTVLAWIMGLHKLERFDIEMVESMAMALRANATSKGLEHLEQSMRSITVR